MTAQTRSQWLKAWLDRQALPQPDGTFLVRPFGWIPLVYQVDAATKDRLIASRVWVRRFSIALTGIFILAALRGRSSGMPWGWLGSLLLILSTASYGTLLFVLRGSPRVPRERWVGPIVIDPAGRFPPKFYFQMMLLAAFLAVLPTCVLWSSPVPAPPTAEWEAAGFALLASVLAVVFGIRYRRSAHAAKK